MTGKGRSGVDVIPAGESGEFRLTYEMLVDAGTIELAAFEALLLNEARARNLHVTVQDDVYGNGYIVRWRPDRESVPDTPVE